jgi:hypothetical protein
MIYKMSAGSMGYVVLVAFLTHILSMFLVGFAVTRMGETFYKTVTVNTTGVGKRRLNMAGSLLNAILSTLIFWGVIAMELGSQEFRDNFGNI